MRCLAMQRARHRELVIELRADPDQRVRCRAWAELEDRCQLPALEDDRPRARGAPPPMKPASEAQSPPPCRRSAHMDDELTPAQGLADMDRGFRGRAARA